MTALCRPRVGPSLPALWTAVALAGTALHAADPQAAVPPQEPPQGPPPHILAALQLARQLNDAFVYVAETVAPSVVVVEVARRAPALEDLERHPLFDDLSEEWKEQLRERFERNQRREPADDPRYSGQGSGVVLRADGHILTNHHVIEEARQVRVRLVDGRQFTVQVRGTDPESDLAVLVMDNPPADLRPVRFADSNDVRVGEFAIAIGAPYELDYTFTFGHVSAKGREDLVGGMMMDQDFIQTDANINPGNSGGPLVNIHGELIGINALIRGMRSGIGFAIPSNIAREVGEQLMETGRFRRSWLGIGITSLRDDPQRQARNADIQDGVVVTHIHNGPARNSDLRVNDIIVAVENRRVATVQQLRNVVTRTRPGTDILLDVYRRGHRRQVVVTLEEMPDRSVIFARMQRRPPGDRTQDPVTILGMVVEPLNPGLAGRHELKRTTGLVVTEVRPDSPAASAGLVPGDVLLEFGRQSTGTLEELAQALKDAIEEDSVPIRLERKGEIVEARLDWSAR